jgi:hypothetical protein
LPDGAVVRARYHADRETWTASLTVEDVTYEGKGRTLFGTLHLLDSLYRNAASREQEAVAEERRNQSE